MTDTKTTLQAVIDQTLSADLNPIKNFLFTNPGEPLIATGSGSAETAGDFAALLYGARGGVATCMSPYTLNSFSDAALKKYKTIPDSLFTLCLNDGTPLAPDDFKGVHSYIALHGSWGRPVADNLEGKLVECGMAAAGVYDYRNFCHGRIIYTSNHLEDSAVILYVSPREKDIAARTRKFLPPTTKLVIIETEHDAPEASLDLLIRSTEFFHTLCLSTGVNPESPKNPGHIDKRKPIWVSFMAGLKKQGPLLI